MYNQITLSIDRLASLLQIIPDHDMGFKLSEDGYIFAVTHDPVFGLIVGVPNESLRALTFYSFQDLEVEELEELLDEYITETADTLQEEYDRNNIIFFLN